MTIATQTERMTAEQFMAIPDDGIDRWLIKGELREVGVTKRNRPHSAVEANFAHLLCSWRDTQAEPRGEVLVGEAGVRLGTTPETVFGVDVAYVTPEIAAASPDDYPYLDGVPLLVVEVLSPSDKHEDISDKIEVYLTAGVKLVCIADPVFKTLVVHRPDREPELFNVTQTFGPEDVMPGLRVALRDVFG